MQAPSDGTVKNIIAHAYAQAAKQLGIDTGGNAQPLTILLGKTGHHAVAGRIIQGHRALDYDFTTIELQSGETLQRGENRSKIAGLSLHQARHKIAQATLIKATAGLAKTKQSACGGSGGF